MSRRTEPNRERCLSPLVLSYEGARPDGELLEWVRAGAVAGVVVFRENAANEAELVSVLCRLREAAPRKLRIMIDEEGGRVRRLPDAETSMSSLRSYRSSEPQRAAAAYDAVAARLAKLGIDSLLAPVLDLGGTDAEWLHDRTFSDRPEEVAALARLAIPAIQQHGVNACAKHFPGLRNVATDPHLGTAYDATLPSEWERRDAVPFRAAVTAGVHMVLVGHQHVMGFDPTRPACFSPLIVTALLRQRLGFAGLVLTDDLAMGAVADNYPMEDALNQAQAAGCDLVLVCRNRTLQRHAVDAWTRMQANSSERSQG